MVLAATVACGGPNSTGFNQGRADSRAIAEDAFMQALGKRDPAAIEAMLRAPVELGGIWFPDAECREAFPGAVEVAAAQLPTLAKCLAGLPLLRSQRKHTLFNTALFQYEPGLEIELRFGLVGKPTIQRIGYTGRRGSPTITYAALESRRLEGDPTAAIAPEAAQAVAADLTALGQDYAYAWLEVCLDETGAVSGVHPREATSPATHAAFAAAVAAWKFKPVLLGEQPTPACAQVRLVHPPEATVTAEVLPVPYPIDDLPRVPIGVLERTSGTDLIPPDDDDKLGLQNAGGGTLVGAFAFCVDAGGRIGKVRSLHGTGFPAYDRKLEAALSGWTYKPFASGGKPIEACGAVVFVYTQTQS